MRFYNIVVTDPATGAVKRTYTSFFNNAVDPGALNIVLDVTSSPEHAPTGDSYVEIHGINQTDVSAASNFAFSNILVMAGMSKGLPLATAQYPQQGIIAQGQIIQSYSNWVGTLMSLHFVLLGAQTSATSPDSGTDVASQQNNIVLNWTRGVPLGAILKNCLAIAFPGYAINVAISDKLVRPNSDTSFYDNLRELATFIQATTQALIGGNYPGVSIVLQGRTIVVFDGTVTTNTKPVAIQFSDLVGQPTWVGPQEIQLQLVMRGDLSVGGSVTLPNVPIITQSSSYSNFKNKPTFTGSFFVKSLRHVGDFRQPDGNSWVTVANVIFQG
jgi:hypothetical protein